jgi:hypothetical protein
MKLALLGLLLAVGCGSKGMDGKLDELQSISDKLCKCTDKKCAEDAHDEYITWKKGNKKEDKPSKEQDARYQSIKSQMSECRHKMGGGGGGGDDSGGGTGGGNGGGGSGSAAAPAAPAAGSGSGS